MCNDYHDISSTLSPSLITQPKKNCRLFFVHLKFNYSDYFWMISLVFSVYNSSWKTGWTNPTSCFSVKIRTIQIQTVSAGRNNTAKIIAIIEDAANVISKMRHLIVLQTRLIFYISKFRTKFRRIFGLKIVIYE